MKTHFNICLFTIFATLMMACTAAAPENAAISDVPREAGASVVYDNHTDAVGGGVFFELGVPNSGLVGGPFIEFGRGSSTYSVDPLGGINKSGGFLEVEEKYNVIRSGISVAYPFQVGENSGATVYPLIRPGVYYWKAREIRLDGIRDPVSEDEVGTETSIVLDVGGGVSYGPVSLILFTSLNGNDLGARLRVGFPI